MTNAMDGNELEVIDGLRMLRTVTDFEHEGRTLVGLALPWERATIVSDRFDIPALGLSRTPYREAHARTSFDVTLRQNPEPRPFFNWHGWRREEDPIGVTHFERAEGGLRFVTYLSRTRAADEQLELVRDGAKRSVSVGGDPVKFRKVSTPQGPVILRTENKLTELSLAPTGFGQYDEARVEMVRSQLAELEAGAAVIRPPHADQLLRLRAGRPLLPARQPSDPSGEAQSVPLASAETFTEDDNNTEGNAC